MDKNTMRAVVLAAAVMIFYPMIVNHFYPAAKNQPPKKSVEQVLSVCEDILCQPLDTLTAQDKEKLLGVLGQYTAMKRRITEQERSDKAKKAKAKER